MERKQHMIMEIMNHMTPGLVRALGVDPNERDYKEKVYYALTRKTMRELYEIMKFQITVG